MSEIRHAPEVPTHTLRLEGGHLIDRHRHDEHQIVYVSRGVFTVQTAVGSWVASRDRAVWLPAGTWHENRFYGASRFHSVGFPADAPPLPLDGPGVVGVSSLLRELLVAVSDETLASGEARRLRAVIRDQLRRSPQEPLGLPSPRDPRLARACDVALGSLDTTLSLADLGRAAGASERTLSRLFREEMGMTYPQWRTNVRVLQAMIRLSAGDSVTAAGTRCGWQTTSAFVDAFRRAVGETPGAYSRAAMTSAA